MLNVGWRSLEGGEVTGPHLHQLLVICFDGTKNHCEPQEQQFPSLEGHGFELPRPELLRCSFLPCPQPTQDKVQPQPGLDEGTRFTW